MPKTRCPGCGVTMRPDVGHPRGCGITEHRVSRVECTDCGRKLGSLNWELV